MDNIKTFVSSEFGQIRCVELNGDPWFVGKDIAEVLGYSKARNAISRHVEEDDKKDAPIQGTPGGMQSMTIINESGLYSLILSSKLPTAKAFKHWVTSEVLPAIRKTGGYIAGQDDLTPEELMARALQVANRTLEERQRRIDSLEVENSRLMVESEIARPKAEYFDQLVDRNLLTGIRETAKELGVKQNTFVKFLIDHKYLYRDQKGKLLPKEPRCGDLLKVVECFNEKTNWSGTQTMVTVKGKETFRLLMVGLEKET